MQAQHIQKEIRRCSNLLPLQDNLNLAKQCEKISTNHQSPDVSLASFINKRVALSSIDWIYIKEIVKYAVLTLTLPDFCFFLLL